MSVISNTQDLAATAVDRAGDIAGDLAEKAGGLASAALERIEELPEQARNVAGQAIPALRTAPKRSKTPWVLLALAVALVVGGVWYTRRRSSAQSTADAAGADRSDRSVAAVS